MERTVVTACLVLVVSSVYAQPPGARATPGPPSHDNSQRQTGTARIRGRVIGSPSGIPLHRARVSAVDATNPRASRSAITDLSGRYEISDLPAGRYQIVADKNGYAQGAYGRRNPVVAPPAIDVADGATVSAIDFSLPKTSVITVRVTDEFGEPVAGASVGPRFWQWTSDGQRRLESGIRNVRANPTDDRGETRIHGLPPGEFVIQASVRVSQPTFGATPADTSEGFANTFYPGTADASEAELVNIGSGEERHVQFALVPGRISTITGRVVDSRGEPAAGASITLLGTGTNIEPGVGTTRADGSFVVSGVANGQYLLAFGLTLGSVSEGGTVPLRVTGHVDGLTVAIGPGAIVQGRVTFEGARPPVNANAPLRVEATRARSELLSPVVGRTGGPSKEGLVAADGSFTALSAAGDNVFLSVTPLPPGWTLKSVTLAGEDITEVPLDLTGRTTVSDLRITITDKLTRFTGGVTDARGQPVTDYVVLIQPAEEKEPLVTARLLRTATPDRSGRFDVQGIRPGSYVATAVEAIERNEEFSPDFQRRLRRAGREFTLGDAQSVTIDLRLAENP